MPDLVDRVIAKLYAETGETLTRERVLRAFAEMDAAGEVDRLLAPEAFRRS